MDINGWLISDTSPAALPPPSPALQYRPGTVLHPPTHAQRFEFLELESGQPSQVVALPVSHIVHRYGDFLHAVEVHLGGPELGHIVPV